MTVIQTSGPLPQILKYCLCLFQRRVSTSRFHIAALWTPIARRIGGSASASSAYSASCDSRGSRPLWTRRAAAAAS